MAKQIYVYELNNDLCKHGTGRGLSCDECARKRGKKMYAELKAASKRIAELEAAIREHRDSFAKDMDEHDWTTEAEALWDLVKESGDD